jgi:hypothetical protein
VWVVKRLDGAAEPIGARISIVVDERAYLAGRLLCSEVSLFAGAGELPACGHDADKPRPFEPLQFGASRVCGVVERGLVRDNQDFEVRILEVAEMGEVLQESRAAIMEGNDY